MTLHRRASFAVLGAMLAFGALHADAAAADGAKPPVAAVGSAPWPHDPERVVRDVLAQPAYHAAQVKTVNEAPKPDWWDEFVTWFKALLKNVFGPLGRAVAASSGAGAVVGLALTVAALLGLAFVLMRLVMAFVAPETRAQRAFAGRALVERRTSRELRATASALAGDGEYAPAIAALFAAALAALDERALVPFDPSRTPGEYRRLVRRARAPAAPPFDVLTAGFVRAAYSGIPARRGDFENAEQALATFEPLVAAP